MHTDEPRYGSVGMAIILTILLMVIVAILIPVGSRRGVSTQCGCINNLRQIDSGKEQAASAKGWESGTDCDNASNKALVNMYIKGIKGNTTPRCPEGGKYTYNPIGTNPVCSIMTPTSHVLPAGN